MFKGSNVTDRNRSTVQWASVTTFRTVLVDGTQVSVPPERDSYGDCMFRWFVDLSLNLRLGSRYSTVCSSGRCAGSLRLSA
jgi:hypothetical protein